MSCSLMDGSSPLSLFAINGRVCLMDALTTFSYTFISVCIFRPRYLLEFEHLIPSISDKLSSVTTTDFALFNLRFYPGPRSSRAAIILWMVSRRLLVTTRSSA